MRVRGIACEDIRRVVHKALDAGWVYDGKTRSSHGILRWPLSGELLHFSFTPGDRDAWKRLASDIERVSGVVVYARVKRHPGYRPRAASAEAEKVARDRARFAAQAVLDAARRAGAQTAAAAKRRRREITDLMRND